MQRKINMIVQITAPVNIVVRSSWVYILSVDETDWQVCEDRGGEYVKYHATHYCQLYMYENNNLRYRAEHSASDFGTNRKLICDFLSMINTNL